MHSENDYVNTLMEIDKKKKRFSVLKCTKNYLNEEA